MNNDSGPSNISITNINVVEQRGGCSDGCFSGCAMIIAVPLVFGAILLLIEWPWLLGSWLAVQLGADEESMVRLVVAWTFEAIYIVLIIAVIVNVISRRR